MTIYLDYNASMPAYPAVLEEMMMVYRDAFGNSGSRTHIYGQRASQIVNRWRREIADFLTIDSNEVFFTSSATESNNLTLLGLREYALEVRRKHIISTALEHKSILEPLAFLEKQGFEVELIETDQSGLIAPGEIKSRIRPDTLLVSMHHANNETGVIQPIEEIGRVLSKTDVFFHVDAAQSFGKLSIDMGEFNIDFLTASAHKMGGPQGVGLLAIKRQGYRLPPIRPIMYGGGQEGGLRPGTLPVALIAGLGKAVAVARVGLCTWLDTMVHKKQAVLEQLKAVSHHINGSRERTMPNVVNVSFPGVNSEALMLATRSVYAISNGSACTAKSYQPSHVLVAMGLPDEIVEGAVRISWGSNADTVDLTALIEAVKSLQPRR